MAWYIDEGRKISKKPSLSEYDNIKPRPDRGFVAPASVLTGFNQEFVKEAPSTHTADKALLVSLGVDGDVPLAQARVNSMRRAVYPDGRVIAWDFGANDNELAVKAA